jgi:hypothetical protein
MDHDVTMAFGFCLSSQELLEGRLSEAETTVAPLDRATGGDPKHYTEKLLI